MFRKSRTQNQSDNRGRANSAFAQTDTSNDQLDDRVSNGGVILFSVVLFFATFFLVLGISYLVVSTISFVQIVVALICATLMCLSLHVAQQWEKVVVLRLGKFNRLCGPGFFATIPIIESNAIRIDGRVRVTTFGAEETLTADLVPLDVNAVLFWMVWDAKAACTEVGNFSRAVELAAQTALRDAIGRAGTAEVALRREQLDRELKRVLEEKVSQWGITVLSVEVRDILMPKELQEAMSLEAQAEQRKKARILLMEAEQDICEMMDPISHFYQNNEAALQMRAMHLLYESMSETGGTFVVPSSFSEGFSDVLPDSAKKIMSNMP